jgi:hypothetical protein
MSRAVGVRAAALTLGRRRQPRPAHVRPLRRAVSRQGPGRWLLDGVSLGSVWGAEAGPRAILPKPYRPTPTD